MSGVPEVSKRCKLAWATEAQVGRMLRSKSLSNVKQKARKQKLEADEACLHRLQVD